MVAYVFWKVNILILETIEKFLFSRKYRILTQCTVLSFITKSAQFKALIAIKASFLSWFILNIALKSEHDMTNERPILEMRAKKNRLILLMRGALNQAPKRGWIHFSIRCTTTVHFYAPGKR